MKNEETEPTFDDLAFTGFRNADFEDIDLWTRIKLLFVPERVLEENGVRITYKILGRKVFVTGFEII